MLRVMLRIFAMGRVEIRVAGQDTQAGELLEIGIVLSDPKSGQQIGEKVIQNDQRARRLAGQQAQ